MNLKHKLLSARVHVLAAIILFSVIGLFMIQFSRAWPTVRWMGIYNPAYFTQVTASEIVVFLRDLRTGIPPILALVEILAIRVTQSTTIAEITFYRAGMLISYWLAIVLAGRSAWRVWTAFGVSLIFLAATVMIHPSGPLAYDIYYPMLVLAFIASLVMARRPRISSSLTLAWVTAAGFFLSMIELTRPFVLIFLPLLILLGMMALSPLEHKRQVAICFLLPILVFSGGWHLKLILFNDGQVMWSNHSGYNLVMLWGVEPDAEMLPETAEVQPWHDPYSTAGGASLNTEAHYRNSQRLQSKVVKAMLANPVNSLRIVLREFADLLHPHVDMYGYVPPSNLLIVYQMVFRMVLVITALNLLYVMIHVAQSRDLAYLAQPPQLLLIVCLCTIFMLAIGDHGEEARFIISLLPCFAAMSWLNPDLVRAIRSLWPDPLRRSLARDASQG